MNSEKKLKEREIQEEITMAHSHSQPNSPVREAPAPFMAQEKLQLNNSENHPTSDTSSAGRPPSGPKKQPHMTVKEMIKFREEEKIHKKKVKQFKVRQLKEREQKV